ncbi:hypothetical protein FRB93_012782 [Tulasnella sp. JGI-2019a]|nr:hypothetical protein FRB93_012782 [Tulasnella sp. JGI-2019a]
MSNVPPSFSSFPAFDSFPDLDDVGPSEVKESKRADDSVPRKSRRDDSPRRQEKRERFRDGAAEPSRKKDRALTDRHKEKKGRKAQKGGGRGVEGQSRRGESDDAHQLSAADLFIQDALGGSNPPAFDNKRLMVPIEASSAGSKGLFIEDGRGDHTNMGYQGLHAYAVPKYRRMGFGEVVGFPPVWKLTRGDKGEVALRGRSQSSKHSLNRKIAQIPPSQIRKLVVQPNLASVIANPQEGFIPLPGPSKKGRHPPAEPTYRSIVAEDPENSDMDEGSSSSSEAEPASDVSEEFTVPYMTTMHINARLTASLKAEPTSISTWLELLEHSVSGAPTSEARSDLAVNIIEKAFLAHPANKRDPTLRRRYLLSGSNIWTASKLEEEWERALKIIDESVDMEDRMGLWIDYLSWRLKAGGVMTLEAAVQRVWSLLESERSSRTSLDLFKLRVLWRSCTAFSEAGYKERACAIFQAQLELVLRLPSRLTGATANTKLDALEEFWEAEAPRIGERSACGWATWDISKEMSSGSGSAPTTIVNNDTTLERSHPATKDPYTLWAFQESQREREGDFPRRTSDEDDDPYTTILFSDIRPFLFNPSSKEPTDEAGLRTLVPFVFLHFLGLNFPGLSSFLGGTWDSTWSDTRFGQSGDPALSSSSPLISTLGRGSHQQKDRGWEVIGGTVVTTEAKDSTGWGPVKEWEWACFISPLDGYGTRGEGRMWEAEDTTGLDVGRIRFLRELFQQVSKILRSPYFDEFWLAFEVTTSVKGALKVSRALLSQDRDSLPRWAAHAKLERLRDKIADARKVYETSLSAVSSNSNRPGVERMSWEWAEMEWISGQGQIPVVNAIAKMVDSDIAPSTGGTGQATMILRVKKLLKEKISGLVRAASEKKAGTGDGFSGEPGTFMALVALVNLAALMELVSGSGSEDDVLSAMKIYDLSALDGSLDKRLQRRLCESLAVASNRLLYHHTRTLRAPIPPSVLRNHVEPAVSEFPDNTLLLGIWLESEKGEMMWGRVKQKVAEQIVKPEGEGVIPTRALWGIWQGIGELGRVRNMLGRVVEGDRSRSSVALWKVAVDLELTLGQMSKSKALLYRALGECPWSKDLYLMPFRHPQLRNQFTKLELDTWVDTMMERQIRIRESIEDYLEGEQERMDAASVDEEGGDAELEGIISERRRLAPY